MAEKQGTEALTQQIKDLKVFIQEQFDHNREEHKKINNHLSTLNHKVAKHEEWQNRCSPTIERWKRNEEMHTKHFWDFFIKVLGGIVIGVVLSLLSSNYL